VTKVHESNTVHSAADLTGSLQFKNLTQSNHFLCCKSSSNIATFPGVFHEESKAATLQSQTSSVPYLTHIWCVYVRQNSLINLQHREAFTLEIAFLFHIHEHKKLSKHSLSKEMIWIENFIKQYYIP
jgi:hypothetical protein